MIQIHEFKTLALPSFPIQNFFIFNSYSHTHSNLKRASSIPKLFLFSHLFFFNSLIRTYSTSILHFIQIHEFETLSFFYMRFFFLSTILLQLHSLYTSKSTSSIPVFFSFFHSFVHTYFTITYTRHMLLKHGFDSQIFFLHIFYFTCSLLQLFFLHLKFFFTTRFFSLHTLLYYYYFFYIFFFYSFLSFTQINS